MKLMLGSAQFGSAYGISNLHGQTPGTEVGKILKIGLSAGLRFVDTAHVYGTSEEALGQFADLIKQMNIVTKLPPFGLGAESLERTFQRSLQRLNLAKVYGLLFHDAKDLLGPHANALVGEIEGLRERGLISKWGVSVYTVDELRAIVKKFKIDLLQIPVSVFDQRFLQDDVLQSLKDLGIEIHARSVFLQGLLFMDPETLSPYFEDIKLKLRALRAHAAGNGYDLQQVALSFVEQIKEIDRIVVGVNTAEQFQNLLSLDPIRSDFDFSPFRLTDEKILLPSRWPRA